ncbi:hypothetical protein GobsT_63650 [Gemmata obscuriglobus]|uniref:Uncharacterized protein n=1 Tax=Gemmata obscuriglobus TaxID=114 RepID=A0A2Z3H3I0_9BACT|nr:hypothetical protein [Gemmata obscuriglobus]AWM35903.1 hypothetical protein C1280_02010 [Gemmata obscuriglobus]AWM38136.1 hypothetical protein C1280_14790 [Gemmata obscuriglobus]QEG28979.1 hypothetical protein GobsT_37680 [Gemmata obscuriglobus]QEG31543.1 hypothetical protein GobsT_63650 [Gemmata obscuriglobus]VTS07533.1 Uncharacterized protein OS=Thalassobacter stenotrophicus GN=PM03_12725 PE=4 SV=1 [Gemmata obscuriglobus UQM 2246]
MPADRHKDTGLDAPGDIGIAVVPSDTTDLPNGPCRAFDVGTAGDVRVIFASDASNGGTGTPVTLKNRAAGMPYPYRVRRVLATGTTGGDITAIY